jgi:hypothetical protein
VKKGSDMRCDANADIAHSTRDIIGGVTYPRPNMPVRAGIDAATKVPRHDLLQPEAALLNADIGIDLLWSWYVAHI